MGVSGSVRSDIPLAPAPLIREMASFVRSDPSFTADGERVIYTRWLSQPPVFPTEIWSAALDGSDDRQLGVGRNARMSPNGRWIAYVQAPRSVDDGYSAEFGATWLMSARTGRPIRELWPGPARSIDWSPDSTRIVFTAARRDYFRPADLFVVRPDGTGLKRLTSTRRTSEIDAVWSPDNRRLAVVRELRRPLEECCESIAQSIWTMRPDGPTAPPCTMARARRGWERTSADLLASAS